MECGHLNQLLRLFKSFRVKGLQQSHQNMQKEVLINKSDIYESKTCVMKFGQNHTSLQIMHSRAKN
jgi:hypothetical protein